MSTSFGLRLTKTTQESVSLGGSAGAPHAGFTAQAQEAGPLKLRHTCGYLVSNTTLEPQLGNTHETPQSSRDEGLLLLYGLESNPESSLQTPQEA